MACLKREKKQTQKKMVMTVKKLSERRGREDTVVRGVKEVLTGRIVKAVGLRANVMEKSIKKNLFEAIQVRMNRQYFETLISK